MQPKAATLNFEDSTLLISARSPFARRVRLAFREAGLKYTEKTVDVLKPTPELLELNPLSRVPTLLFKSGGVLVDSSVILESFYEWRPSPLFQGSTATRAELRCWSALACGMAEKTVEYFFETQRPEASRDPELLSEVAGIVERVLGRIEAALATRETIMPQGFSQADLDVGTALRYLCVRRSSDWRESHPRASKYLDRLEARPSFQGTVPPAA
jgi:glutathione S-transferase